MPITRSIHETAAAHPKWPAITSENCALSYRELVQESPRIVTAANWLHRKVRLETPPTTGSAGSVGPAAVARPVTAVCTTSAFEAARIMAALAGAEHVFAAIDPRWPVEHQRNIVRVAGIGVVIVDGTQAAVTLREALDEECGEDWGGIVCTITEFRNLEHAVDAETDAAWDGAAGEVPGERPDDEPFLMLFSSGTTAVPKAFLKTRGQYRANLEVSKRHLGVGPEDGYVPEGELGSRLRMGPRVVTFAPGPFAYSLTLYAAVEALATGGTIHLSSSHTDGLALADLGERIARERITRIVTVPAMLRGIITQATRTPELFARLKLIVVGGADLPENLRHELAAVLPNTELISYYGAAEIGFIGQGIPGHPGWHEVYNGVDVQIRDENGAPVREDELGTIWVRAASASDGYVVGGAAGNTPGPGSDGGLLDESGWASVGDQGRTRIVNGRRQVQVVGRAGDIINTGGHKVALPEVTRAYADLTVDGQAFDAVAVGLPDATLGTVLALAVEDFGVGLNGSGLGSPRVNPLLTKAALREWGRERLAPQFVPAQYYVVSRLPRTVGGKIKTAELAELLRSSSTARTNGEGVQRL
ncbi:class I adenylate-forming enzyme family protein [Pseudoglutamicibacter albus]|uniref:class I adenylate-forming enzyme family protein n=1 Tax=Pseudoglutamicibacter albus TaxID=98671 RepID=UPI000C76055B|nr:class I adenylate-forming enzyme family protein [Pseudoglutamicibacter albus]PKY80729.1 long-chain fatty acid--CoA ligase [Pseudoglutamicibacter albus]WIK85028.1 class I adenylate-forming enzyme family protein [Pseudoglutamicibacter albus]